MAACCDKAMAEYGDGDMKGLEAIWRVTIVNKLTQDLSSRLSAETDSRKWKSTLVTTDSTHLSPVITAKGQSQCSPHTPRCSGDVSRQECLFILATLFLSRRYSRRKVAMATAKKVVSDSEDDVMSPSVRAAGLPSVKEIVPVQLVCS
ncbi:hypothetical protein G6O67_003430 [Ophiocordyceps sinensis]|uniref:Uncharacterized protein n=1 Tax=Ophiocordyceps sinensis TaxID=72228 RepID=A0A8H4V8L2_9HYPO|nr:hypothetical protein G6O67_003430 [Ophiocordyceps sinensis]